VATSVSSSIWVFNGHTTVTRKLSVSLCVLRAASLKNLRKTGAEDEAEMK
jgi:hypothetical protein